MRLSIAPLSLAALGLALVATTGFFAGVAFSQDPGQDPARGDDPPAFDPAMMQEAMRLAQPGPEHEELVAMNVGTWDQEFTMHMMPGMPPMKSKGTATNEAVLGGRFIMTRSSGSMMGMPIEHIGFVGFDRRHEEYVTIGLDSMGTYFVTARGKKEADGIVRMHGRDNDPMGEQVYYFEIESDDQGRQHTRLFFSKLGPMEYDPPHMMMQIVATKRAEESEEG